MLEQVAAGCVYLGWNDCIRESQATFVVVWQIHL